MNSTNFQKQLKKRHRAEWRFRAYGILAVSIAIVFLGSLITGLVYKGAPAFFKTEINLDITFKKGEDYETLLGQALEKQVLIQERSPENLRKARHALLNLLSPAAPLELHRHIEKEKIPYNKPFKIWLRASDSVDTTLKTQEKSLEDTHHLSARQNSWIQTLEKQGKVRSALNIRLITGLDSREPEQAGLWGAIVGSLYTLLITLLVSLPLGIGTAIYLEEFAPNNGFSHFIEVTLSNLAAVPSIIFGLLGLSIFLNVFNLPRSSALVGGLTLALIMMPTVVIATRASLKAIPQSIRDAAHGLGASQVQTTFHHVFPLALPGIITGTILGIARALGESAPLLMIGMVAFIVDPPLTPLDSATTLPVQIFSWARNPERGFVENTAAAILVLLFILSLMSLVALILRKRFEKTW
ncbi:MAG: phosphate ABC transporter permease PstA [bacterium]|nr:phosphate ABC transporter permease PstA [bacterium]